MKDTLREQIGLTPQGGQAATKTIGKIKGLTTFFADAAKAAKGSVLAEKLAEATPWWAGAAGTALADSVPVVKFAVDFFAEVTKEHDPGKLGLLACTLAYERSVEEVFRTHWPEEKAKKEGKELGAELTELEWSGPLEFKGFSFRKALNHPFVVAADRQFECYAEALGYNKDRRRGFIRHVHRRFVSNLKTLLSHGKLRERFQPFTQLMAFGTDEESAYDALLSHVELQRWRFAEAPVFGKEPFALAHVYIATECGRLKWGETKTEANVRSREQQERVDPFREKFGGRHDLLETVLTLMADPKLREAIVIQGVAGSGKSSFTLKLAAELEKLGLTPLRVRLRDLPLDRPIGEALSRALFIPDDQTPESERNRSVEDPFMKGAIFHEEIDFRGSKICPHVLILDGWDEISISAAEGFKIRVNRMLEQIRSEYLQRPGPAVRVVMTGRPSAAVEESTFLRHDTPLLTVRPLSPDQLKKFLADLRHSLETKPVSVQLAPEEEWRLPGEQVFAPVFASYEKEFGRAMGNAAEPPAPKRSSFSGSMEVLGLPLLAHLAFRLIAQWKGDPAELVTNPTTLYRGMIDLTCQKGGKPSDDKDGTDGMFRIPGHELRRLLHRTAVAMTVCGEESISYQELALRLNLAGDELDRRASGLAQRHTLSALLIAFFFKGGHLHLGCEFLHKSFREFLFAEAVIEELKEFGRTHPMVPLERDSKLYWKDFEVTDPRHDLSRKLGEMLAPQWLSSEVVAHLQQLVPWEIARTLSRRAAAGSKGGELPALELERWKTVRDALADVWDWWGEGVHLRPQPQWSQRRDATFGRSLADEWVEFDLPFDRTGTPDLAPARVTTMDAHLGDALFRLNCLVHYHLAVQEGWIAATRKNPEDSFPATLWSGVSDIGRGPRRCQSNVRNNLGVWVLFRPSAANGKFFASYMARVDAAAWRPQGSFPNGVDMSGCDFRETNLRGHGDFQMGTETVWTHGNLDRADCEVGSFWDSKFVEITAQWTAFSGAAIGGCSFDGSDMKHAKINHTFAWRTSFVGAILTDVDAVCAHLDDANFTEAVVDNIRLAGASLKKIKGLNIKALKEKSDDNSAASRTGTSKAE